ncbi:MAG TPA: biopolymer transporter ExbD [Candidatus Krumholzibacteria bacterium]|nr:biopolymer transporter ExbD [Candidatus Krumholzibacteria bacterium]
MAVKIKKFRRPTEEMNMSSIADIVFLLLIYFMVVTVFQQDIGMPFVLPAAAEQEETVQIKESNTASLQVTASNIVLLDDQPMAINGIKNELERRLLENPKLVVIVENHPMSDYGVFAAVLDEVRLAKCRKVAIKMMDV